MDVGSPLEVSRPGVSSRPPRNERQVEGTTKDGHVRLSDGPVGDVEDPVGVYPCVQSWLHERTVPNERSVRCVHHGDDLLLLAVHAVDFGLRRLPLSPNKQNEERGACLSLEGQRIRFTASRLSMQR